MKPSTFALLLGVLFVLACWLVNCEVRYGRNSPMNHKSTTQPKPLNLRPHEVRQLLAAGKVCVVRRMKLPTSPSRGIWEATTIGGDGCTDSKGNPAPEMAAIWHTHTGVCIASPFGPPGTVLVGREATESYPLPNILTGEPTDAICGRYSADKAPVVTENGFDLAWWHSKPECPAMQMPLEFSRFPSLRTVSVRAGLVQIVTEEEARLIVRPMADGSGMFVGREGPDNWVTPWPSAREAFRDRWEFQPGHSWDDWAFIAMVERS